MIIKEAQNQPFEDSWLLRTMKRYEAQSRRIAIETADDESILDTGPLESSAVRIGRVFAMYYLHTHDYLIRDRIKEDATQGRSHRRAAEAGATTKARKRPEGFYTSVLKNSFSVVSDVFAKHSDIYWNPLKPFSRAMSRAYETGKAWIDRYHNYTVESAQEEMAELKQLSKENDRRMEYAIPRSDPGGWRCTLNGTQQNYRRVCLYPKPGEEGRRRSLSESTYIHMNPVSVHNLESPFARIQSLEDVVAAQAILDANKKSEPEPMNPFFLWLPSTWFGPEFTGYHKGVDKTNFRWVYVSDWISKGGIRFRSIFMNVFFKGTPFYTKPTPSIGLVPIFYQPNEERHPEVTLGTRAKSPKLKTIPLGVCLLKYSRGIDFYTALFPILQLKWTFTTYVKPLMCHTYQPQFDGLWRLFFFVDAEEPCNVDKDYGDGEAYCDQLRQIGYFSFFLYTLPGVLVWIFVVTCGSRFIAMRITRFQTESQKSSSDDDEPII